MGLVVKGLRSAKQPLAILFVILFIFGVDLKSHALRQGSKLSKLCHIYQKLVCLSWFVFLSHVTATFLQSDMASYEGAKAILSRKLTDAFAFCVWIILVRRRHNIYITINAIFLLPNTNLKSRLVYASTSAVLGVPLIGWLSMTVPFKESDCLPLVKYFSLQTSNVPDGYNCSVMYPIMFVYNLIIYTLRTALAAVYVLLCCSMSGFIKHYTSSVRSKTEKNTKLGFRDIQKLFDRYDKGIKALKSIEKSMSFPIFLLQISDLIGLFSGFVRLDPLGQRVDDAVMENYRWGIVFVSLRALTSFLFVCLAASGVHEADKEAKEANEGLLKELMCGGRRKDIEKITSFCILNHHQPFALSAGGFFYFTRGLVLSAVGSVLTYSLLILQINFT